MFRSAEAAGRVYLSRLPEGDVNCDYINAVFVDGFRTKSQFITTQMPLPHTVADFWRMVLERKSTLVIVLNQVDMADPVSSSPRSKTVLSLSFMSMFIH